MANRNQLPSNEPPSDPSRFRLVLLIVVGIAAFSAICQIVITETASPESWPRVEALAETFKTAWIASVGALLALLGNKKIQ